jgi:multidrug transporter EmrE-like cation transporter
LSVWIFKETINVYKIVGIAIIIGGVIAMGFGSKDNPEPELEVIVT